MRILRPMMPLLAAGVLVLGTAQAHAEPLADRAEAAFHSCVADFARSLILYSPLELPAIREQSLRSCDEILNAYRRLLTESPERLASDEVEVRLAVLQSIASEVVGLIWDKGKDQTLHEINEGDFGIWVNPDMSEEETAASRRRGRVPSVDDLHRRL